MAETPLSLSLKHQAFEANYGKLEPGLEEKAHFRYSLEAELKGFDARFRQPTKALVVLTSKKPL